jgi:hypothetical protein
MLVIAKVTARHSAFHQRARRALVVEELAFLQRLIARLLRHLLLAGA